jgi:hypothetical protein
VRLDAAGSAVATAPLALHVDPAFDVFRLLDPRETPPSIGQIFGEPRPLVVLPSKATEAEIAAYRALIEGWRSDSHQPEVKTDAEVRELPAARAVWLLGRGNALAPKAFAPGADYSLDAKQLVVDRESMPLAGHCAVIVRRHPAAPEKAVGWIFADGIAALPGLGRKLPHYGKYSYLGFEGDEPVNVFKGQWTAADSPLRVDLRPAAERGTAVAALVLAARRALAELPPVFSQQALMDRVAWLSAPEREGRGVGTKGLDAAAEWIAAEFRKAGLEPGGDGGTYFQQFESTRSPSGKPVPLRNVVGVLRGSNAAWAGQSAVLGAHYDHLGSGWPDVHKGDEGRLHPGADDNASGWSDRAREAIASKLQRTLVFVAFAGERGSSRALVEHPPFPLEKTLGVINLDTVGRLADRKLSVLATGSASEWQHIFRGAGFVTGIEGRMIPDGLESSDQKSFIDRGVPAVQVFTDPHADYHRPGDTADKIDGPGLVKVATFVREGIVYLGERPEPLTNTIAPMKGAPPAAAAAAPSGAAAASPGQGRRVSFGTMPDFAFAGPGVKVAGVTPGSPAAKAGSGGRDPAVDDQVVANLASFSESAHPRPGQRVKALVVMARTCVSTSPWWSADDGDPERRRASPRAAAAMVRARESTAPQAPRQRGRAHRVVAFRAPGFPTVDAPAISDATLGAALAGSSSTRPTRPRIAGEADLVPPCCSDVAAHSGRGLALDPGLRARGRRPGRARRRAVSSARASLGRRLRAGLAPADIRPRAADRARAGD